MQRCRGALQLQAGPASMCQCFSHLLEVVSYRETVVQRLSAMDAELRANGQAAAWKSQCTPHVRAVVDKVNGPLLAKLVAETGHSDGSCIEMLQHGRLTALAHIML